MNSWRESLPVSVVCFWSIFFALQGGFGLLKICRGGVWGGRSPPHRSHWVLWPRRPTKRANGANGTHCQFWGGGWVVQYSQILSLTKIGSLLTSGAEFMALEDHKCSNLQIAASNHHASNLQVATKITDTSVASIFPVGEWGPIGSRWGTPLGSPNSRKMESHRFLAPNGLLEFSDPFPC